FAPSFCFLVICLALLRYALLSFASLAFLFVIVGGDPCGFLLSATGVFLLWAFGVFFLFCAGCVLGGCGFGDFLGHKSREIHVGDLDQTEHMIASRPSHVFRVCCVCECRVVRCWLCEEVQVRR